MSVSLQKGQKVNLSKEHAGLAKVIVGLGWDEAKPSGGGGLFGALFGSSSHQAIDCDASAIMLKNGKFTDKTDLVYFGNLKHKSGTVNHMGDNLTGAGEGDDEQIVFIRADHHGFELSARLVAPPLFGKFNRASFEVARIFIEHCFESLAKRKRVRNAARKTYNNVSVINSSYLFRAVFENRGADFLFTGSK